MAIQRPARLETNRHGVFAMRLVMPVAHRDADGRPRDIRISLRTRYPVRARVPRAAAGTPKSTPACRCTADRPKAGAPAASGSNGRSLRVDADSIRQVHIAGENASANFGAWLNLRSLYDFDACYASGASEFVHIHQLEASFPHDVRRRGDPGKHASHSISRYEQSQPAERRRRSPPVALRQLRLRGAPGRTFSRYGLEDCNAAVADISVHCTHDRYPALSGQSTSRSRLKSHSVRARTRVT